MACWKEYVNMIRECCGLEHLDTMAPRFLVFKSTDSGGLKKPSIKKSESQTCLQILGEISTADEEPPPTSIQELQFSPEHRILDLEKRKDYR